jgi:N-methylhydantoinase B
VRIHARVQVEPGGVLVVDVRGCDDQVPFGVNVPIASTHAAAYFAVRAFLGREAAPRHDAGLGSRVRVVTRPGSVLDPARPAAVSARHLTVQRLTDVLVEALGRLLPDRAVAGSQVSFPAFVFQAVDGRHGRVTLLMDILGGGTGARRDAPGDSAIDPYTSNCALLPAEIAELEYPWLVEASELVHGSGGAGAHAGGLALRRSYRLLADAAEGMYYVEQADRRFAPAGRAGGGAGAAARVLLRRAGADRDEELPGKGYLHLRRGDVVTLISAGGGGYGNGADG